jgi:toxin secretion/phage lysis holin
MNGELSSKEGRRGITKKVGMIFLVIVVYQADKIIPNISGWEAPLRDVTISALIVNDFISIIENLGEWGVPIPEAIKKRLEQLRHNQ